MTLICWGQPGTLTSIIIQWQSQELQLGSKLSDFTHTGIRPYGLVHIKNERKFQDVFEKSC